MRLISVCLALFFALPLWAKDHVTHFHLENGMEVVVLEDHRAPVVVHMVWYKVGSADEPAGTSGIAHFLEHLMFKATDTLASGEFSAIVAANGGSDNAFTSYDFTAYFQRVAADRLETVMEMEANRMVNLRLVEDDIAPERDVVIEERNQRTENSPGALFNEQRRAAQYLNHRYGVPIIGWQHEIETMTLEDALAFYDAHYAPNNTILVVAGDVQPDDVKALAQTYYGTIPANPDIAPRNRPAEPKQLAERRLIMQDDRVAQPYMSRTYLAPERDAGDQSTAAALVYLAELLGGSQSTSVLARALQFDTQTALYSAAYYSGRSLDDTTFGLIVAPAKGVSLRDAEEALDAVLANFLQGEIDLDAFERIKMQIKANEIYAMDNVQSQARAYGAALTSGLTVADVQAWPDILAAVTPQDVMDAAKLVFRKEQSVTGWLMGPEDVQ